MRGPYHLCAADSEGHSALPQCLRNIGSQMMTVDMCTVFVSSYLSGVKLETDDMGKGRTCSPSVCKAHQRESNLAAN